MARGDDEKTALAFMSALNRNDKNCTLICWRCRTEAAEHAFQGACAVIGLVR